MDEIVKAVEEVKKQWDETSFQTQGHIKSIEDYGKSTDMSREQNSLPRLNSLAQDGLAMLNSLQLKLDILAPQLPAYDEVQSALALLENWKEQSHSLRVALRNANLQAKENIRKSAQQETIVQKLGRDVLYLGFHIYRTDAFDIKVFEIDQILEGTPSRRWQRVHYAETEFTVCVLPYYCGIGSEMTKAGMTSAAESITESLRRSRQLMAQELERSASTLMTFEDSTGTLKKAESEYKGHRSLLMRTRNLLSTMQRQDVIDRVIIIVGFLLFSIAVLYVVSKRIGILKLQRVVVASIKAGMFRGADVREQPATEGLNVLQHDNVPPAIGVNPAQNVMHDEL
ncbi:Protein transport protein sec20 [Bienertia sinuspersici]